MLNQLNGVRAKCGRACGLGFRVQVAQPYPALLSNRLNFLPQQSLSQLECMVLVLSPSRAQQLRWWLRTCGVVP